jgi:hypothetical protein
MESCVIALQRRACRHPKGRNALSLAATLVPAACKEERLSPREHEHGSILHLRSANFLAESTRIALYRVGAARGGGRERGETVLESHLRHFASGRLYFLPRQRGLSGVRDTRRRGEACFQTGRCYTDLWSGILPSVVDGVPRFPFPRVELRFARISSQDAPRKRL